MFKIFLSIIFSAALLFVHSFSIGQLSSESFGKNRIQRKRFQWKYIETRNFEVHYYGNNKDLATYAARQAEENYDRISNVIGFSSYSKIKLMVYASIADLHQSNIGLEDGEVLIGGNTNFVKSRVEVAYRGTRSDFNKDINKGIANVIINVMMYGGSLKDAVQSSYLLSLPDWYLEGASRYIAEGWSMEMDNYVRDMFLHNRISKLSNLEGREAYIVGHSVWNFIAKNYGEDNIANILNLTRIIRDEEESVESTLGMSFDTFVGEWEQYYGKMAEQLSSDYVNVSKENRIKRNARKSEVRNLVTNPEGTKIAYSVHYKGKFRILISDTLHRRTKVVSRGGYKLIQQPENLNIPLLSWATNRTLAYMKTKRGKTWLRLYDSQKKKRVKILIDDVDEVLSFDFSPNGKFAVISAVKNGQSDIFQYDLYKNQLRQITNDAYDDIQPRYLDSTLTFFFSSNRTSDTLSRVRNAIITPQNKYNIFKYDSDSSTRVLQRISNSGNNFQPSLFGNDILYLSDRKGIYNLYKYSYENRRTTQISNYIKSISAYSANYEKESIIFTMLEKGSENLYYLDTFDFGASMMPMATARQQYLDVGARKKNEFIFKSQDTPVKDKEIDINEFNFESDKKKQKQKEKAKAESAKNTIVKKEAEKFLGPYNYKNRFSVDKLVSTVRIDPLRGFGIYIEGGMSDLLGNHKMDAGIFQAVNLRSNGFYGEYAYLKKRIDFKIRYERQSYYFVPENIGQRYTLNNMIATASYPLSIFNRISLSPFITTTRFTNYYLASTDQTNVYGGLRAEYVYDNTEVTGMNMIKGTKVKATLEEYRHNSNQNLNFGRFSFDLRHYQPLHKELVLAARASFGSFLGPAKKNFVVGGMDNWIFNSTNHDPGVDPLKVQDNVNNSDLLFARYITSLRGFDYNTIFGSRYMLFNAELRIPIVRYLYSGTIASNFFRNLQLTAFTDVGSSWSGKNPFSKDNNINRRIIDNGNGTLVATVINYKNPFLIGYGFGARTLFLGYYVKCDLGWGLVNSIRQQPKFYLTLGYDF